MSSFKKREKVLKREHRERGQLQSRKNLGILEKHKDYVLRAKAYNKKKAVLKSLHEKARNKNPDEFYYKMVKTSLKEGRHVKDQEEEAGEYTPEQLALMKTRDLKYLQMKVATERQKIEKLTGSLHLTDQAGKKNTHTYFVDLDNDIEDIDSLDVAQGQSQEGNKSHPPGGIGGYRELNQRLNRLQELKKLSQRMDTKKKLLAKERCVRIPGDCSGVPVTYKWFTERKR